MENNSKEKNTIYFNDMEEKIDILIPVYNVKKYINNCLNSLINQTYKNINIIINENGSTDGSDAIVEEYAKKYDNIKLYHTPNEKNISKARNFLLSKIESKYFTFFDSDDVAEPDYVEVLYNILKDNQADMSICVMTRESEDKPKNLKKRNKKHNKTLLFDTNGGIAEMLSYNLFAGTVAAKMIKTEKIEGLHFDESIHYGEDLDFSFKVMSNCEKIAYTQKSLYHYKIRKNSIVTSKFNPKKLSVLDCFEKIMNKVDKNEELLTCAKSMYCLVSAEMLYYIWRDKYKDKELKHKLKKQIKENISFVRKNKRLSKLYRKFLLIWRLTKLL